MAGIKGKTTKASKTNARNTVINTLQTILRLPCLSVNASSYKEKFVWVLIPLSRVSSLVLVVVNSYLGP